MIVNPDENGIIEDEQLSQEELKQRIRKDRRLLRKMDEERERILRVSCSNPTDLLRLEERFRRKKLARSEKIIQKHMRKIMEVCKGKGFVYGILPEKGKPITGSSESLRRWWNEKVKFELSAPTAISDVLPIIIKHLDSPISFPFASEIV